MQRFGFSVLLPIAVSVVMSCVGAAHADSYTFTTIDLPGVVQAYGINNVGQIVGGYEAPGILNGFLLSQTVLTQIAFPNPPGTLTRAYSINNGGDIVGDYGSHALTHGFLLSEGVFTPIDVPNAVQTHLSGINDEGQIVGFYVSPTLGTRAFLFSGDRFITLNTPGIGSFAAGINDTGQIVGGYTDVPSTTGRATIHGFVLSGDTFTTIDAPMTGTPFREINTSAYGINNRGEIVGAYNDAQGAVHGFLLSNGVFMTMDFPEAGYTALNDINDRSDIAGFCQLPFQGTHGFLATKTQLLNDLVKLQDGGLQINFDPTPVPNGAAGTFVITTTFQNISDQSIYFPVFEVVTLELQREDAPAEDQPLLLNADVAPGRVGVRFTPADSLTMPFEPETAEIFQFRIGLQTQEPFTFFVNIIGEPRGINVSEGS